MKRAILFSSLIALVVGTEISRDAIAQEPCHMKITFAETSDESRRWNIVNDGVMGGLSEGKARMEDGVMIFEGYLNTNGGGFSSVRRSIEPGALSDSDRIKLRVKSDGRQYKLTFRTDMNFRGRTISFQRDIPQTPRGEWAEVDVPLTDMRASIFGRTVSGARFDKSQVWQMGIILADGQDGPFQLMVEEIEACG